MLRSLKDLQGYDVWAADGRFGRVSDFMLDDEQWAIRYLVVETGGLLNRHHVLVTPRAVTEVAWATHRFQLALTKTTVQNSPEVDLDEPVSRRIEEGLYDYYGYPQYWDYGEALNAGASPALMIAASSVDLPNDSTRRTVSDECHLRSAKDVRGDEIQARDGSIGHVDDFIVDDGLWKVRYMVVDTSNWWLGKKVLIAPQWAVRIDWPKRWVELALTRDEVKASPEWDPERVVDRDYEQRLHTHYRQPSYWDAGETRERLLGRRVGD